MLLATIVVFCGCNEDFQNVATKRFDFIIDSINKEEIKNDKIALSHNGKPNRNVLKKDVLICSNDTVFIQTFFCQWTTYEGEPANKLCFYALCKNREGKMYELLKPVAWLEKVHMDSYVSRLNEKRALIDAIYRACLIAGEEKHL